MPNSRSQVASCLAALSAACAAAQAPQLPAQPSIEVASLDRTVDPCSNFYQFACGGWLRSNPIPGDKARWARHDQLAEKTREVLHQLLEEAAVPAPGRDPIRRQVGDYYAACMDTAAVESAGLKPLQPVLARIDAVASREELLREVALLQQRGVSALFNFSSAADLHDATTQLAQFSDGGITLPDRDYYLKDDAKSKQTRERYQQHVQRMLELAGAAPAAAAAQAKGVLQLETQLARANLDRTARRDPKNRDHRMTLAALDKLAPHFLFTRYLVDMQSPAFESLNVVNPGFFHDIDAALVTTALQDWKAYLRFKLLHDRAAALPEAFVNEYFEFFSRYLRGQKEQEARWKRCVRSTDSALGEALGQLYVARNFPPEARARMLELVAAVEKSTGADIESLPWMSGETRKKAQEKLAKITNKVGYPDKWRDYSSLAVERTDYLANLVAAQLFEKRRQLTKIGTPVDKAGWEMTPPTVNAYYSKAENNINFPAGILQGALYQAGRDDAVNFGGIGAVIGHEITHGFDDQGAKFDSNGNLTNWWSDADKQEFERRTACLAAEYESFSPVPEVYLNGKLTLGENTADNGGLRLALLALQEYRAQHPAAIAARLDGFGVEQRFFLGYAQTWCQNWTPEFVRLLALTDPHSPGEFRVNGVVVNSEVFAEAFQCKSGQAMVSANPCRVW